MQRPDATEERADFIDVQKGIVKRRRAGFLLNRNTESFLSDMDTEKPFTVFRCTLPCKCFFHDALQFAAKRAAAIEGI